MRFSLSLLVLGCTLWGTGGLLGSVLSRTADLSPLTVATYRLGLGGALIVAFALVTGRPLPRGRRAWRRVTAMGFLAALFQAGYFAAVAATSVSLATLITIGASPVLVLVAEALTGRRRVGPRALGIAALALTGLTLLVGTGSGGRLLAGTAFALLAAAGFATVTLIASRPVPGVDDLSGTGTAFVLGSLLLLPAADLRFAASPASLGVLALFAVVPTAIAWTAYFRGLRSTPAGTAALMALLEPLVGTALSVLLLGEHLSPAGMTGAALLITALILESIRPRAEATGAVSRQTQFPTREPAPHRG